MNIFHIGTIAFENDKSERELKAIGGISGYIIELINYTNKKKHKVGIIGKIYNYEKSSNIEYIQVQDEISNTNSFLFNLFLKTITLKLPVNSIIHAHRPDHLATYIFFNKTPSVVTLHGQQAHTVNIRKGFWVRKIYQILENYALKKVNRIIAVDAITQAFYSKLYPQHQHKICIIPTGVNTEIFYPMNKLVAKKAIGFDESSKLIIYVGRIEPPKKIDIIINAFAIIAAKDSTLKLLIVGDGVLRNEMEKLSQKLQLVNQVYFLGVRKRNELAFLYNAADVSVLISSNEGSPLSVKESLACGVPVVANNVGDISSIIKDNYNGYIVDIENLEEISDKIMLAINKTNEYKQNCVDSIQQYTIPVVAEKVLQLYEEIANE